MKERYLLELGGENTDLGKYEALELLKFKQYSPRLEFDYGNIIVITTSKDIKENIIARLSMTKRISKVIFSSSKDDIEEILKDLKEIKIDDLNFAIRQINGKNLNSEQVTLLIGEKISEKNETNLDGPQVTVLYYKNENFFISLKYSGKNTGYKKCLKHHISNRPYFSPIGIHPRVARAMINLSNCADDRTLIDPFCGTGGVLIEGADMGLKVIGIDLKDKMIEFSKGNLRHYGFKGKLINSDFKEVADLNFGSIVCGLEDKSSFNFCEISFVSLNKMFNGFLIIFLFRLKKILVTCSKFFIFFNLYDIFFGVNIKIELATFGTGKKLLGWTSFNFFISIFHWDIIERRP